VRYLTVYGRDEGVVSTIRVSSLHRKLFATGVADPPLSRRKYDGFKGEKIIGFNFGGKIMTGRTNIKGLLGLVLGSWMVVAQGAGLDPELDKVAQQGKDLFSHATFDGNGAFCESCHRNGGVGPGRRPDGQAIPSLTNAAALFPRYKAKAGRVCTLQDQIRGCVGMALQGKAPAYGSDELTALTVYVTSLAQGKPLDMGGKPQ
jgi:thiosulfate dehydrogenase